MTTPSKAGGSISPKHFSPILLSVDHKGGQIRPPRVHMHRQSHLELLKLFIEKLGRRRGKERRGIRGPSRALSTSHRTKTDGAVLPAVGCFGALIHHAL